MDTAGEPLIFGSGQRAVDLPLREIQGFSGLGDTEPRAHNGHDRVLPFLESEGVRLLRVLADRGSEYCGNLEHHEYELLLALEDIDHTKAKASSPQTNSICERLHRMMLDEFYRVAFRRKLYASLEELQRDADEWIEHYITERTHSGKYCHGKTPMETFWTSKKLADEKMLDMLLTVSAAEVLARRLSHWSRVSDQVLTITTLCTLR